MMNNEESPRNPPFQQGRRPPAAGRNYESRENRGFSNENRYGQNSGSGYNKGYNSGYSNNSGSFGAGQRPHHNKVDRFKRDPVNYSEKLTRQNDLIIKLLKEIRDRLPAPAYTPSPEPELEAAVNHDNSDHEDNGQIEQPGQITDSNEQPQNADPMDDSPGNG